MDPGKDISIAITISQNSKILTRGSVIVDIVEGVNTVELTLGLHSLKNVGATGYSKLHSMRSFDNVTLALWNSFTDTSQSGVKTWKLSKFDEAKGVFTGNYTLFSDAAEYLYCDYAADASGNIFFAKKSMEGDTLSFYAISAGSSEASLLTDTIIIRNLVSDKFEFIADASQNLKFFVANAGDGYLTSIGYLYNVAYSGGRLIFSNLGYSSYESLPYIAQSEVFIDTNDRIHIGYFSSSYQQSSTPYTINWKYTDNQSSPFSNMSATANPIKTMAYSAYNYVPQNMFCSGGNAFITNSDSPVIGYRCASVSAQSSTYPLIVSSNMYDGTGKLRGGSNGNYIYYFYMGTDTKPYILASNDFGATWSSYTTMIDSKIWDIYPACDLVDANNYSVKFFFAATAVPLVGGEMGGYSYYQGVRNAYIAEQFGAGFTYNPASDATPPVIVHTQSTTTVTAGASIQLIAAVTDNSSLAASNPVTLYYMLPGGQEYSSSTSASVIGSAYTFTISSGSTAGTFKYYFKAIDAAGNISYYGYSGQTTTDPATSNYRSITVEAAVTDSVAPVIQHTKSTSSTSTSTAISLAAYVTDAVALASSNPVTLYYKLTGASTYTSLTDATVTSGLYTFSISSGTTAGTLQYYFKAIDAAGNISYYGVEGQQSTDPGTSMYLSITVTSASTGWTQVGNLALLTDYYSKIVIAANNGTPYIIWTNSYSNQTGVLKFSTDWSVVGTNITGSGINSVDIALTANDTPYIIYTSMSDFGVKKFNGTAWVNAQQSSMPSISYPSNAQIALASNCTPVFSVIGGYGPYYNYVYKLDNNAYSYTPLTTLSETNPYYASLAIEPNYNTPHLVFKNGSNNNVMLKYYSGGNWYSSGYPATFMTGYTEYTDLAIDTNYTPYVVGCGNTSPNKAVVYKLQGGENWTQVGSDVSEGAAIYSKIVIYGGVPYVAYQDGANSNKMTVKRFNGTSWELVGTAGFTSTQVNDVSLSIGGGYIFVACIDTNSKMNVYKFQL